MSSCRSSHVQKFCSCSHMSLLTVHLSASILRVAAAPLTLVIFSCRFLKKKKMKKRTKKQRNKMQMTRRKMIKKMKTSSST